jgi:hypothetical protein
MGYPGAGPVMRLGVVGVAAVLLSLVLTPASASIYNMFALDGSHVVGPINQPIIIPISVLPAGPLSMGAHFLLWVVAQSYQIMPDLRSSRARSAKALDMTVDFQADSLKCLYQTVFLLCRATE